MKLISSLTTALLVSNLSFGQNTFPTGSGTFAGIGTTSPTTALHIRNNSTSLSNANFLTIDNRGTGSGSATSYNVGGILFSAYRDVRTPANIAGIWTIREKSSVAGHGNNDSQGSIVFGTDNIGTNITTDATLPPERMRINSDGAVLINTTTGPAGYKLAVNGSAIFTSVFVKLYANWPDYVFKKEYKLMPLSSVEDYIKNNGHLPDMPSEEEIKKGDGVDLGEINTKLLQKVEELTLYLIQLKKENEEIKKELEKITNQD